MISIKSLNHKPSCQEIVVIPFGECNNRCTFCDISKLHSSKYSETSFSSTLANFHTVIERVSEYAMSVKLSFMGGELIQDKFDREYYKSLSAFIQNCIDICVEHKLSCSISISSNLLATDISPLLNLYDTFQCKIKTSFDFAHRFKSQKLVDKSLLNLDRVSTHIDKSKIEVQITTFKQNIERILSQDSIWQYLISKYNIRLSLYEDMHMQSLAVTEKELAELYIFLYKKYKDTINDVAQLAKMYCSTAAVASTLCSNGITVYWNKIAWQCCNKSITIPQALQSKQCYSCKYFSKCGLTCFRLFYNNADCYIKEFFKFLDHEQLRKSS